MKRRKIFYGWWVAGGLYFSSFFGINGRLITGALGPTISRDMGWSTTEIMLGTTITLFVFATAGIFVGRLIDTIGGRKVITVGGVLLGAGFILLSLARELWQLWVAHGIILGVAVSMTFTIPEQSVARKWFVKRAGLVGAILTTAFSLSLAIAIPLITRSGVNHGWRITSLFCAISGVAVLLLARLVIRDTPESIGLSPYGADDKNPAKPVIPGVEEEVSMPPHRSLRTVPFRALCLSFGVLGIVTQGFLANVVFWGESVGANPANAGLFMTAFCLPAVVGKLVWGLLGDRFGKRRVGIIGSAACIAVLAAGWMSIKDVASLYLFCIVFGLVYAHFVVVIPYMGDLFGRAFIGTLTGYTLGLHGFLGAVGPIMWSRIFDARGTYNLACLVSAGIYLLILIGFVLAKPLIGRSTMLSNMRHGELTGQTLPDR